MLGAGTTVAADASVQGSVLLPELPGRRWARGCARPILASGVEVAPGAAPAPGAVIGEGERVEGLAA